MTCPKCKKSVDRLTCTIDEKTKKTYWACSGCRRPSHRGHVYTGRKIWWGPEVYGNRYGSDEARSDVEDAMLGGSGSGLKG